MRCPLLLPARLQRGLPPSPRRIFTLTSCLRCYALAAYRTVRLSVQRVQLDDMLPGTPFPVVLSPSLQQQQQQGGANGPPVLAVSVNSVVGGARGRSYLPVVAVRQACQALMLAPCALLPSPPAVPVAAACSWQRM